MKALIVAHPYLLFTSDSSRVGKRLVEQNSGTHISRILYSIGEQLAPMVCVMESNTSSEKDPSSELEGPLRQNRSTELSVRLDRQYFFFHLVTTV